MDTILTTALSSPATEKAEEISAERFDEIMRQHQRRVYRVIYLLVRDSRRGRHSHPGMLSARLPEARQLPGRMPDRNLDAAHRGQPGAGPRQEPAGFVLEKTGRSGRQAKTMAPGPGNFPHRGPRRNARCWRAKNWKPYGTLCLRFRRSSVPFSSCAMRKRCRWHRSRTCCSLR